MTRPGADMGKTKTFQQSGNMPFVVDDAEALLDHALQINPAPAHHTVTLPIGPGLDQGLQFGLLCSVQTAGRPRMLMIAQAIRPFGIEAVDPVPQRLAVHAAHAGRIRPVAPSRIDARARSRRAAFACWLRAASRLRSEAE